MLKSSESKVVVFDASDVEAKIVQQLFYSLQFEYTPPSNKPTGFKYLQAKDNVKWVGLKAKDYLPLLSSMFSKYQSSLP